MNTIIVDDRNSIREFINELLKKEPVINVIDEAANVKEAISKINDKKPDLILLDIQMPDGTGFDVLEGINYSTFKVIFITSYEEFAIKAFKYSALDYVVKPIEPEAFYEAIDKAKKAIQISDQQIKIKNLIQNLTGDKKSKKLVLNTQETVHIVDSEDIIRCESDGSYTQVFTNDNKKILLSKKIKDLEELLSDLSFFRVHRSHLINLNHVDRFEKRDGGYIVMKDQAMVSLSQNKKDEFFQLLQELGK
jgi:two-component system LytT family response regulator